MVNRVGVLLILLNIVYFNQCVFGKPTWNSKVKIPKCCDENEVLYQNDSIGYPVLQCKKYTEARNILTDIKVYDRKVHDRQIQKPFNDIFEVNPGIRPNKTKLENYVDNGQEGVYLSEDGILYLEYPNAYKRWIQMDKKFYCVDHVGSNLTNDSPGKISKYIYLFSSIIGEEISPVSGFTTTALLISSAFLLLVLIVYSLLPELRNLAGKVLMAYIFSQFFAFLLLAILQMSQYEVTTCVSLSTTTYFFFISSFCWMNVMSFDIWWMFRGYAKARRINRRGETFKFLVYCTYGWGVAIVMSIALVVINEADMTHMPWFVKPLIDEKTGCFLQDGQKLVYLYIPMVILITTNWILFLMTAFNIWRINRDIAMLDSTSDGPALSHRQQRHRLYLYIKLSVIMGVSWILEVVSSFAPSIKIWYLSDAYNSCIGVSIFIIFVCKKKIFLKLKARYPKMLSFSHQKNRHALANVSNTSRDDSMRISTETQGTNQKC